MNKTMTETGLTFPTVTKSMGHLERLGIVQEVTRKARDRRFRYGRYIQILSEGTEPIR